MWYDTRYSQFMGVPVALSDSGSRGKCACVIWHFNTGEPPTHLLLLLCCCDVVNVSYSITH